MIFRETSLKGAYVVEADRLEDERGFFARVFCRDEFEARGLNPNLVQCSVSFNKKMGTLRGMHYQVAPHEEAKLARCTRGAIYDVIADIRPTSPTYMQWLAVELAAEKHTMLYIPEGFAHGFQTLADNTEIFYQISESYDPDCARGFRWNDPAFSLRWPITDEMILSSRDLSFEDYVGS